MTKFKVDIYLPSKVYQWYRKLDHQQKMELAKACNKSASYISEVMCRKKVVSLALAKDIAAYSNGVFTLEDLYPVNQLTLQATPEIYKWYSKLTAQEKAEVAEQCHISTSRLSQLMRSKAFMSQEIMSKITSLMQLKAHTR